MNVVLHSFVSIIFCWKATFSKTTFHAHSHITAGHQELVLWWEGGRGIIIITVRHSHKHCVLASLLHRQFIFSNSEKTVKNFFFLSNFFSAKEANHLWYQMAVLLTFIEYQLYLGFCPISWCLDCK